MFLFYLIVGLLNLCSLAVSTKDPHDKEERILPLGHITFLSGNDEREDQSFWKEIGSTVQHELQGASSSSSSSPVGKKKSDLLLWLGNSISASKEARAEDQDYDDLLRLLESKYERLRHNEYYSDFLQECIAPVVGEDEEEEANPPYNVIGSWDDNDVGNTDSDFSLHYDTQFPLQRVMKLYKEFLRGKKEKRNRSVHNNNNKKNKDKTTKNKKKQAPTLYSLTTIPFPKVDRPSPALDQLQKHYEHLFCVVNLDVLSYRDPFPHFETTLLNHFFSPHDPSATQRYSSALNSKIFKQFGGRGGGEGGDQENDKDRLSEEEKKRFMKEMLRGEKGEDDIMQYPNYHFPSDNLLGETQWEWLEETLKRLSPLAATASGKKQCAVTLLSSAWQVLLNDNKPFVGWDLFPFSRSKLLFLLSKYQIERVLLLSGHSTAAESGELTSTNGNKKMLYSYKYAELLNEDKDDVDFAELFSNSNITEKDKQELRLRRKDVLARKMRSYTERSLELFPPSKRSRSEENRLHDAQRKASYKSDISVKPTRDQYGTLLEFTSSGLSHTFGEKVSLADLLPSASDRSAAVRREIKALHYSIPASHPQHEAMNHFQEDPTALQQFSGFLQRTLTHTFSHLPRLNTVFDFLFPRAIRRYLYYFFFFAPVAGEGTSQTQLWFPRYFTTVRSTFLERNYGTVRAVLKENVDPSALLEDGVEIIITLHRITGKDTTEDELPSSSAREKKRMARRFEERILKEIRIPLRHLPNYKNSQLSHKGFLMEERFFDRHYIQQKKEEDQSLQLEITQEREHKNNSVYVAQKKKLAAIEARQNYERSNYRFFTFNTPTQMPSIKRFLLSRQCPEWSYCLHVPYTYYERRDGRFLTRRGRQLLLYYNQNVYPSLRNSALLFTTVGLLLMLVAMVMLCLVVSLWVFYYLLARFGKPKPITVVRLKID